MEEFSFGDFSDQEVNDLYTQDCDKIEFVWQRTPSSPQQGQPSLTKNSCTPTKFPGGALSPNIPPNPPTSPIDGSLTNTLDENKRLNINALPFVPGTIPANIPSKDVTENKTQPSKLFIGASELNVPHDEPKALNEAGQASRLPENLTTPTTSASTSPPTTTVEIRNTKPSTPTPPLTTPPAVTTPSSNTSAWSKPKQWAAILGTQPSPTTNTRNVTDTAKSTGATPCYVENVASLNEEMRLTQLKELSSQLAKWRLSHNPVNIQPRGLVNQGNWCYMHAPLQALLSCPEFYNLFQSLATSFPGQPSSSPITDTMIQFVHEFKPYPKTPSSGPEGKTRKKGGKRELHHDDPFRPDYVYDMLYKIKSSLSIKGRQEDAEEFLGCVLDGLHEEMLSAKAALETSSQSGPEQKGSAGLPETGDDVEWEQVGPKNKSAITRQTTFKESPIAEIFGGQLRSSVHRQKAKESATLQPFFSLQLDIQSEKVWDIKDALEILSAKETVHMSEAEAHKKLSISLLPPVLILHLKRFVFDKTGGSQKLLKQVSYSTELEISKELLSSRGKLSTQQRSYQLWAVVYHHGKTSTGGHYTCDVNHPASGGWIRADDSIIRPIPEDFVLKPPTSQANKVAYILFYRRSDTIRP